MRTLLIAFVVATRFGSGVLELRVLGLHELRQFVLHVVVFLDVVQVVHPAGKLRRNRTLRLPFLLLIGLLWTLAFGRGRRTEITTATTRPAAFTGRATGTRSAESAWARTTKATTRARAAKATATAARSARSTKPAASRTGRTGATVTAARAGTTWTSWTARRTARTAILARARFAHREWPAHEELTIELPNRGFRGVAVGVFDKGEAAGATGFAVERTDDLRRLTDLREMRSQVLFGGLVWKIPYEQSNWWHGRWRAGLNERFVWTKNNTFAAYSSSASWDRSASNFSRNMSR